MRLRGRRLQRHRRDERLPGRRAREPYGYEAGGNGPESGKHAIRFAPGTGQLGMFQGTEELPAGNRRRPDATSTPTRSPQAFDYASVGPEHAWLKDIGRVNYSWATDEEAMNAFRDLSQTEGIIPAIESSHAVAGAYKAAADRSQGL